MPETTTSIVEFQLGKTWRFSMIGSSKSVNTLGIPDFIIEGREFLEWASEMDAKVGNNNWLERSIVKLEKIRACGDDEARELFEKLYDDPVVRSNNLTDMIHLRFIRKHIGMQDPDILKKKLSEVLRGGDSIRNEVAYDTRARDARFELSICARLNSFDIRTRLADPNPDMISIWRRKRIAVEAKRVFSGERIEERIAGAHRQLRDRLDGSEFAMRIIYCDITRSLTSGTHHIKGKREAIFRDIELKLTEIGLRVQSQLVSRNALEVDFVVVWYQDFFEPTDEEFTLQGMTQCLAIDNPLLDTPRRRNSAKLIRKLSASGL
jgi:hypothetical protein